MRDISPKHTQQMAGLNIIIVLILSRVKSSPGHWHGRGCRLGLIRYAMGGAPATRWRCGVRVVHRPTAYVRVLATMPVARGTHHGAASALAAPPGKSLPPLFPYLNRVSGRVGPFPGSAVWRSSPASVGSWRCA